VILPAAREPRRSANIGGHLIVVNTTILKHYNRNPFHLAKLELLIEASREADRIDCSFGSNTAFAKQNSQSSAANLPPAHRSVIGSDSY
jgi:hypothetical protein